MLKRYEGASSASKLSIKVDEFVIVGIVFAVVLAAPMLTSDSYLLYLVALVLVYSLPAMGLNVIMGYGPDVSLGQHGLFAVGAYGAAIAMERWGFSFLAAVLLGALAAAVVSGLIAFPALRLHGLYLAIGTLAFGLAVHTLIQAGGDFTGGRQGMSVSGVQVDDRELFYKIAFVFMACFCAYWLFVAGRYGRLLMAVKDNKLAAQAMGVSVVRVKIVSFLVCGFLAGAGGAMYAVLVRYIASDSFLLTLSLLFILMVVVGGAGSVYGPVLGAAFAVAVPEFTSDVAQGNELIFGTVVMLVVILMPSGAPGLVRAAIQLVNRRPARAKQAVPAVRAPRKE